MQAVEVWNKINESVRIVAWPGVVIISIFLFRVELKRVFQRLREIVTPAGSLKLDPMAQAAAAFEIEASAGSLMESVAATRESSSEGDETESGLEARTTDMRELKDEVEGVIRSSFVAGFQSATAVAGTGKDLQRYVVPQPVIKWEESTPRVIGFKPFTLADAVKPNPVLDQILLSARRQMVMSSLARLKDELEGLDQEIEQAAGDPIVAENLRGRRDRAQSEQDMWKNELRTLARDAALLRRIHQPDSD